MNYDKWQKRLAGIKVPTFPQPDENDIGFYRKPITVKQPNGRNKILGWEPIAYFISGGMLCGRINNDDMSGNEVIDLWTWCCAYPITEDQYRAVAERGEDWFDAASKDIPAANREVAPDDNDPPEVLTEKDHAAGIDTAISAAIKTVTNEIEAAQALGSKNRIAELRLAAAKAGKAEYDSPYREYVRLRDLWAPMVARADAAEKALNKAVLTFREKERVRIAKEQAEADERQRLQDEANARAADRAIAAGETEQPPIVEDLPIVVASAPILPTYGTRKLKEEVKTFLDSVNDFDAVYTYFRDAPEVKAFLTTLATAAIKAGRTVPGTTTREGLI